MTDQAIIKAKKHLNAIISNYCMQSYLRMNRKKDGTFYKKHIPYSIPTEAKDALDLLKILNHNTITIEEEEEIKGFLLPYRTVKTEYLINTDERLR